MRQDDGEKHSENSVSASELTNELFGYLENWLERFRSAQGSLPQVGSACLADASQWVESNVLSSMPNVRRMAKEHYTARRIRDQVFADSALFGEPAWDILLDLALAESQGERLSVTSVCLGSCSPETTALRWLGILEKRDLLRRERDISDQRRHFVRLTERGARKMRKYFKELVEYSARSDLARQGLRRLPV